jgi:hypothetical protein
MSHSVANAATGTRRTASITISHTIAHLPDAFPESPQYCIKRNGIDRPDRNPLTCNAMQQRGGGLKLPRRGVS